MKSPSGTLMLALSIVSRFSVVLLLCTLALWTEYLNLKLGYNSARLVELSSGVIMRWVYELSDSFFSLFGDPLTMAERTGGMTWSVRLLGVPFTDPVALLSVFMIDRTPALGFALGALIPIVLAICLGSRFSAGSCLPHHSCFSPSAVSARCWGAISISPISTCRAVSPGACLPAACCSCRFLATASGSSCCHTFAMGQTIFHSIAFGTLSVAIASLILFALLDLFRRFTSFTCRKPLPDREAPGCRRQPRSAVRAPRGESLPRFVHRLC